MKLFVTGGAGFIGSNFIQHVLLSNPNHSVIHYDKLTYARNLANLAAIAGNPRYHFAKGDICAASEVEAVGNGWPACMPASTAPITKTIMRIAILRFMQFCRWTENLPNKFRRRPGVARFC
jgi:hypothetical protein